MWNMAERLNFAASRRPYPVFGGMGVFPKESKADGRRDYYEIACLLAIRSVAVLQTRSTALV